MVEIPPLYFHPGDVMRLISPLPYLTLGRQRSVKAYLDAKVNDGRECQALLARFPEVRYEPLDQHYVWLRCLAALCEELVSDLCHHNSWREVNVVASLVVLAPDPRYAKHLLAVRTSSENRWLVDLALAEIEHATWPVDPELQASYRRLRTLLATVPMPERGVLRRELSASEIERMNAEREAVKRAYRAGGLEAAREAILETQVLRFYRV